MRRIIACGMVLGLWWAIPAESRDNGLFVGGSIGSTQVSISGFDPDFGDLDFSDRDNGYKLFVGFRLFTFFAAEASYVDFGTPQDTLGDEEIETEVKLKGFDAFAVGLLPLGPVDVFAKVGFVSWDADIRSAFDDFTQSDSGTDPAYGVGAAFNFGSFAVRGEVEYFDVKDADDVYMLSLGLSYTF